MTEFKAKGIRAGFLVFLVTTLVFALFGASPAIAQTKVERPDAATLLNGDLILPRNPKAIVAYDSSQQTQRDAVQKQWETERDAFVAKVRRDERSSQQMRQLATNLEALSYAEFTLRYLADAQRSDIEKYGAVDDIFSVGHVGIVEVAADQTRFVIEAVLGEDKKVRRIAYADWLKLRPDAWVWVARIRNAPEATKQKFVDQAKSYVERPYNFWNFDLGDDTDFYCSKLVWLSYMKASGLSIDGPAAQRSFWFSPKQLWNLQTAVERINVPRDYSY